MKISKRQLKRIIAEEYEAIADSMPPAPEEAGGDEEEGGLETADEKKPTDNLLLGTDDVPDTQVKKTSGQNSGSPVKPSGTVKSTGNKSNTKARRSQGGGVYDARSFDLGVKANKTTPSKERYIGNSIGDREVVLGSDLRFENQENIQNQMTTQLRQTLKSLERSISNKARSSALLVEGDEDDET